MFVIPDMSLLNTFRNEFDRNVVSKSFFFKLLKFLNCDLLSIS